MAAARAAGFSVYSTDAEESVMEAPKPAIVWNVRPGSTTTVGAVVGPSPNASVPRSAILSVPSGVVIHTCAAAGAGGWPAAAPGMDRAAATRMPAVARCLIIALLQLVGVRVKDWAGP